MRFWKPPVCCAYRLRVDSRPTLGSVNAKVILPICGKVISSLTPSLWLCSYVRIENAAAPPYAQRLAAGPATGARFTGT